MHAAMNAFLRRMRCADAWPAGRAAPAALLGAVLLLVAGGCGQGRSVVEQGNAVSAEENASVRVERTARGYVATEAGDSVLVYHRRPVRPGRKHARSHYVHPLFGPSGEVLTENFPDDHPHQHGLFWAWHQVFAEGMRVGDGWTQEDLSWEVPRVETSEQDDGSATIKALVRWRSERLGAEGERPAFLKETATIRIHPARPRYRLIDFEIALEALTEGVRLGGSDNEKGYGGFSPRLRLPEGVRFTGPEGSVTPRRLAVAPRAWMDVSAPFAQGKMSGVAVLHHPSTAGFPQPWILRESASMQNAKWPGRTPVAIPRRGKPITLRYRLVVHRGGPASVPIERLQSEYAAKEYAAR
jgi:hypothetical protein